MNASPAVASPAVPNTPAANAGFALTILTLINLVNYLDRFILSAVLPGIQKDFQLTNTQAGSLATMFMVVFMLASPVSGILGDRMPRRYLVAAGVLLWSLATGASGLATSENALR